MYRIPHWLAHLLIYVVLLLILATCIPILVSAYRQLNTITSEIASTYKCTCDSLSRINADSLKTALIIAQSGRAVEQIKAATTDTINSSMVSFLFQMFSVALVSVGVYLLSETAKRAQSAEQTHNALLLKLQEKENASEYWLVSSCLLQMRQQLSDRYQSDEGKLAEIRELLDRHLLPRLKLAVNEKVFFGSGASALLSDILSQIRSGVRTIQKSQAGRSTKESCGDLLHGIESAVAIIGKLEKSANENVQSRYSRNAINRKSR